MRIILVKNGIFPVTRDKNGNLLREQPATGFGIPGTIQGEGKLAGIPVLFVRTSGCNLRCIWRTDNREISICDTPYASHYPDEQEEWEVDDVIRVLRHNMGRIRHVIISGGEPTIQPLPLCELAKKIKTKLRLHITLETNGVNFIQQLAEWIDLFSISPKLSSSEPDSKKNKALEIRVNDAYIRDHRKFRKNIPALQHYINACMDLKSYYGDQPDKLPVRKQSRDFQLKFVISSASDIDEIKNDYLKHLNFFNDDDILLMPVGGTRDMLRNTTEMTARLAIINGWRFSPRLQIDLFNDRRDV